MSLFNNLFNRKSEIGNPKSGLYHYLRENADEKSRIHLRVDPADDLQRSVRIAAILHVHAHEGSQLACMRDDRGEISEALPGIQVQSKLREFHRNVAVDLL